MNTMQQEFDAVVAHLFKQGRQASKGTNCLYRADVDGQVLSCAVGCRIPDSVYDPEMDVPADGNGTSVSSLVERFSKVLPPEIPAYQPMFDALQGVHDDLWAWSDDSLAEALKEVAEDFDLTFTRPEASDHG